MKSLHAIPLLALALAIPLSAQQIQISKENKTIAVTTSDEASALADTAVVSVGFTSYGKDQDNTYADASRVSNAISSALISSGLQKEAIESNTQELSALEPNSGEDKARYSQGLRFRFQQSWNVTVSAPQAASVLHLAITNGANDSGGIQWKLANQDALEAEAAKKALQHAREVAERMAQGLGTRLGPLVYASNQSPPRGLLGAMGFATLNTESASLSSKRLNLKPLAISPDRITLSATVYAVFSIE